MLALFFATTNTTMAKPAALPADLNTLKVTQLRTALKERGLDAKGKKAELIGRLQEVRTSPRGLQWVVSPFDAGCCCMWKQLSIV